MVMDSKSEALHPTTVVVVDDDAQILSAMKRIFRDEPYELLTTQDPYEAWTWIKTRPVDVVIADEFMPAMSGTELLDATRRQSPASARVVITGYPNTTVADRALQQGVHLFLVKPWEDQAIRDSVKKVLVARGGGPGELPAG